MIKKLVKRLLRRMRRSPPIDNALGIAQPFGRMAARDRFADIRTRLKGEHPVIVDGGANCGGMTDLFLRQYSSPTIHAFEPIPELARQLTDRFAAHPNITIHGVALGAETKTVNFNVVANLVSSSVLFPSEINRAIHGERMDIRQIAAVQQVRLDEVLGSNCDVDLLKLDLQGYELEALKGCGGLLERIKIITTEIEFVTLYDGQPLFADIDSYLCSRGFRLLNLYELYTHPDGQLTAGDAVYLNCRYF